MKVIKRCETGITLLEVLLVLAIAASMFVLGIRQYYVYRMDADMLDLRQNVDILFQAAANYYQANCPKGRELDPEIATDSIKPIDISADLIMPGYLADTFPTTNPLVDSTGPGSGYVVQFNKFSAPRMQEVCSNPPTCTLTTSTQVGMIVVWKIQVGVLLKNVTEEQLANAKNYLQADCLSTASESEPTITELCSSNLPGNYVVFERLPSYVNFNVNAQTTNWVSNPLIKQFNQMYTTNPITDLTNQSHEPEYQYYYCSG